MARLSTARIDKATPRRPHAALALVRRKTASGFVNELVVAISTSGIGSACPTAMTAGRFTENFVPANAAGWICARTGTLVASTVVSAKTSQTAASSIRRNTKRRYLALANNGRGRVSTED